MKVPGEEIPVPNDDFSLKLKSVLVGWSKEFQDAFLDDLSEYAKDCWVAGYDNGQYSRDLTLTSDPVKV